MAWRVEFTETADRELAKLDSQNKRRVLSLLQSRVTKLNNPRSIGAALQGERFGEFWKYRVGDFRLICKIEDARMTIVVVRVGHRREIYR